ncbi:MAG: hypothetical protein FWD75_03035 [Propionibacteriaceae bacterium]|nr:hypothetical protein [Propionibacteriaceae bacterium]
MSAVEIPTRTGGRAGRARALHVVRGEEVSAHYRRLRYGKRIARARMAATMLSYVGRGSMAAMFGAAVITIVMAFLAVPNIPLP